MTLPDANKDKFLAILGDDFFHLSNEEKINFLFALDKFGRSFLEEIVTNHPEQIEQIFNSKLLNDLDSEFTIRIFINSINNKETILNLACRTNTKVLDELLNSKTFTNLDSFQQIRILRARSSTDKNLPLLLKGLEEKRADCLSILVNSATIIKLGEEKIFDLLNDKDISGKNSLHKSIKKSLNHFDLILNSILFSTLSIEQRFNILNSQDYNTNSFLLYLINRNAKEDFFKILFESQIFNHLTEVLQMKLLYLGWDNTKVFWIKLFEQPNSLQSLIKYGPKFLSIAFVEFIKDYYWEDCCPGEFGKILIREKMSFIDILSIANNNILYKSAVDKNGYSILYYLASYGISINELRKYQNDYDFRLITRDGYEVIVQDKNILFTYKYAKQDILIITGKYSKNDIISGIETALHQKGINILAINANYHPSGKDSEIGQIIGNYSRKDSLDFIIIHAHGNPKDFDNSDVALFVYEKSNKISSQLLFQNITDALGNTKPINIFLTSCNGQLATKVVHQILPKDSTLITVGERTNTTDHRTQVWDIQNIAKNIQKNDASNDFESKEYTVEKMLIDYLTHISLSNLIKGLPTYVKVGEITLSFADFNKTSACVGSLSLIQRNALSKTLCNNQDQECADKLKQILSQWSQKQFGERDSIKFLQANHSNIELGMVSAIKFVNHLYCHDTFNQTQEPNESICCSALEMTSIPKDYFYVIIAGTVTLASLGMCCLYDQYKLDQIP